MNRIIDLKDNATNISSTIFPNQIKDEYTHDDYLATLRYIASQWNTFTQYEGRYRVDVKEIGLPLGFASRAYVWQYYYFGEQSNLLYDQVNLNADGSRLAQKTFRGMDIFKFVNFVIEPLAETIKRIPKVISGKTVSEDIVSKTRQLQDFGKFMIDQRNMAEYMNQKFGMWLETANGVKFGFDGEKSLQSIDYREELLRNAINVGKDVYYRNFLEEELGTAAKFSVLTGLAGIKVNVVNGYVQVESIPAYEAIFPISTQGDQHRNDQYGGRLRFLTVTEAAARYKLPPEQLKELQSIANNKSGTIGGINDWTYYNTLGSPVSFQFWSEVNGVPRIACVEGQWASWTKEGQNDGRQTLREGVLIGNRFLVDCEITKNQSKDWRNPLHTDLDYIYCQPMSVFGRNMGFPEMIHRYQNRVDYLQTKVDYWINRCKGSYVLINGAYLDPETDAVAVMKDITDIGVHVTRGVDEDAGDVSGKMIEEGAIEMPRDIAVVINEIALYRNMMADILNIPDAARGQLEGYVPEKTLNFQQSQSGKGTKYFYDPMNIFFQRVIQKAVDKFKISTLSKEKVDYTLIVGDTGTELLQADEDFGLSKHAIYLGFEDVADDGFKQRMMDMLFNYSQQPDSGYTMSDFTAVEGMHTRTEINNYFQFRDFQIKQEKLAAQQAAAEQAQADLAANNETQMAINNEREQGANMRQAATLESKEDIESAKIQADLIKSLNSEAGSA